MPRKINPSSSMLLPLLYVLIKVHKAAEFAFSTEFVYWAVEVEAVDRGVDVGGSVCLGMVCETIYAPCSKPVGCGPREL